MRLGMGLGLGNLLSGQPITGLANKYSFNFDGSNDYLDISIPQGLVNYDVLEPNGIAFSAWVNTSVTSGSTFAIVGQGNSTGNGSFLNGGLYISNNKLQMVLYKNSSYNILTGSINLSANTWNHVCGVYSGENSDDKLRIYVNGVLDNTSSALGGNGLAGTATSAFAFIGRNINDTTRQYFNGLIDEVAIWDTALSASDVAKIYKKPVDFSKASTYATDRTSNLKLWLRAGDKAEPESTTAIARQDFYTDFDGTDDYVDCGDDTSLDITGALTLGAWIKTSNTADFQGIIARDDGIGRNYGLQVQPTSGLAKGLIFGDLNDNITSTTNVADGVWHHVVFTFIPSTSLNIYVDGVLEATTTSSIPSYIDNDDVSLKIGTKATNNFLFNGQISNASIYKTALDAQTISQMAKSRFTPMRDNRFSVVDFDGGNDYIALDSEILLTGEFTFNFWLSTTFTGTNYLAGHSTNDSMIRLNQSISRLRMSVDGTTLDYITSFSTPADGSWFNLTVTRDSSNVIRAYVDGVQDGTTVTSSDTFYFNRIASYSNNIEYNGSMSSASVYNTAKSAEEIYAIYQQGITYDESSLSGLVGLWRMGDDTSKAYPTIADSSSNSNDGTITNGASDDIVQQMVGGWDLGSFESSSEELSANHLDNGDFSDGNTDWTETGDFTISNGVASITSASQYSQLTAYSSNFLNSGKTYKLEVDITTLSISGVFAYRVSGGAVTAITTSEIVNDKYTTYFTMTQNGWLWFQTTGSYTGLNVVIDNVSIKEVLQSEVSDTYPAIIDVNEPVLGAELITNGDFELDSNWADYNTPTVNERSTEQANGGTYSRKFTADAISDGIQGDTFSVTAGKTYKVSVDVYPDDNTQIRVVSRKGDGSHADADNSYTSLTQDAWNTLEFTYVAQLTGSGAYIAILSKLTSGTYYIDNVTVKEIQGNVGTMTNQDSADLVYSSVLPDQSFLTGVNSAYNFIDLDGSDEYIDAGALDSALEPPLSISMWVKGDSQYNATLIQDDAIGSGLLYTRAGNEISLYTTAGEKSYSYTLDNTWIHIAVTQASSAKPLIYVNGDLLLDGSQDFTPNPSFSHIKIGGDYNEFDGSIGQSAIWNKVLSSTEVGAIYTLGRHGNLLDSYSDNLKGYWAMSALDASTGLSDSISTIYDRSGNSNHGTPQNADAGDLASSPNAEPNGYAKGDTNRSTTTP